MLPARQRRRLLDPDHVIFQPQISIDVLLRLKMPGDDPRPIRKRQHPPIRRKLMLQLPRTAAAADPQNAPCSPCQPSAAADTSAPARADNHPRPSAPAANATSRRHARRRSRPPSARPAYRTSRAAADAASCRACRITIGRAETSICPSDILHAGPCRKYRSQAFCPRWTSMGGRPRPAP